MKQRFMIFSLLVICLLFCSCAAVQELIQKPSVSFKNLKIEDASLFDATFVFQFDVHNPNMVGATLNSLSYDLDMDGKNFIEGIMDKGISLPAGGSSVVEVPIKVQYLDFVESVSEFVTKDEVAYDLSGSMNIWNFDIPYSKKGNFSIPDLPKISLKTVEIQDLSLMGASLLFQLQLNNENPFAVNLSELDYTIKLGETQFASGTSTTNSALMGNGKTTIDIPLNVNFLQLGQAAATILSKSSSGYEISGSMDFNVPGMGLKSFPFQRTGDVNLQK